MFHLYIQGHLKITGEMQRTQKKTSIAVVGDGGGEGFFIDFIQDIDLCFI